MVNLFDIMRQAQGGAAFDNLGRQFGLPADQTQRAVEALLPAFALGLQRNAAFDPAGFARLFADPGSNPWLPFFEKATQTVTPQAEQQGHALVAQLFGSPLVSQGVVKQAASATGIGSQVLRQMLPILAGVIVAGLVHAAMNQDYGAVFNRLIETMRTGGLPEPAPRAAQALSWADVMGGLWGVGATPPPKPKPPVPTTPLEAFGQIFEVGREVQTQHVAVLQTIFDSFWGKPPAR